MAVTRYISYKCYNFIVLRYNTASLCLALNVAFSSTQNTLVKVFVPLRPLFHLYTIRFITNITASLVNKSYSCSLFRVKFINVSILCAIQRRGRRGSPVTDALARQRGALPFTSLNTAVAVNPEIIPCFAFIYFRTWAGPAITCGWSSFLPWLHPNFFLLSYN